MTDTATRPAEGATAEATLSAGHLIAVQLEAEGVERVYGVPGESYLDLLDGLHDSEISAVITRHEGGAGFMALAEGRLTGLPGVAMVTRGPGAANAFIAVHTAWQDATPLVLFVGLIPVADRGRESFQEFDVTAWFGSTAKAVWTLDVPERAADVVAEAFRVARSGRPGPVVIGLPEDVLARGAGRSSARAPLAIPRSRPSVAEMDRLRTLLEGAERPVLVVGGDGWDRETGRALTRWAVDARIPILSDFRAYDAVPHAPEGATAFAGSLGYGRSARAAELFDRSDLALFVNAARTDVLSDGFALGSETPTVIAAPGDIPGHQGRRDLHLVAAPAEFVAELARLRIVPRGAARFDDALAAHREFSTPRPAADDAAGGYADLDVVMQILREELEEDAVVTFGAGNHAIWPARYLPHRVAGTLVAPRNGAMGVGIPAAVAASLVEPGRQVVSIAGDGCFLMNGQEIATAVGYGATPIAIVADNGIFATIREHQENHYPGRPSGTHLTNPDFAALARSFGGHGETVRSAGEFREAFRRAVASRKPAVIHLHQDPSVRAPGSH